MPACKKSPRAMAQHFKACPRGTAAELRQLGRVKLTLGLVERAYKIDGGYLLGRSRGCAQLSHARQVLHYLAHICFGINYTALSGYANRDRTSIAHGCERVEDKRDDAAFDKSLYFAEFALAELAQAVEREQ